MEPGEPPVETARRELQEEAGIVAGVLPYLPHPFNSTIIDGQPWVTLFLFTMLPLYSNRKLTVPPEPERCREWRWFPWFDLPSPLFAPLDYLVVASGHQDSNTGQRSLPG